LSDDAILAITAKKMIPAINVNTNKPQIVAKKYFKKLFIMVINDLCGQS
jgi:hypothetical protein